jgi:HEPN domain-containing protein
MSKDEVAETIHSLMSLLSKIEDKKLKGELEDQIIALCDQLKFTMIIDRVNEKKANEK